MKRVNEVLIDLGLAECQNTRIGLPGQMNALLRGEKKRLAFASALLTNPALLFCDEPTTGLDSFMAEGVVMVLKKLAARGKTIICTIHQPASEVFELFDTVMLVADGRLAYAGKAGGILTSRAHGQVIVTVHWRCSHDLATTVRTPTIHPTILSRHLRLLPLILNRQRRV
jgi:ABC-type multidrug transport system ATPase subunit